jgi:hypothetical protein
VTACPKCLPILAKHIVEQGAPWASEGVPSGATSGAPPADWAGQKAVVAGYQRALKVVSKNKLRRNLSSSVGPEPQDDLVGKNVCLVALFNPDPKYLIMSSAEKAYKMIAGQILQQIESINNQVLNGELPRITDYYGGKKQRWDEVYQAFSELKDEQKIYLKWKNFFGKTILTKDSPWFDIIEMFIQ